MHRFTKLALVVALVAAPFAANARSALLSSFNSRYGTTGTALDSCNTCHPNGTSSFNAYANDLIAANISTNATNAYAATEPLDSDRDGFTNLVEIQARTFPGLASSFPAPAQVPQIAVSPASLAFGNVTVGAASTAQTVTVRNAGTATLSVSSIARCTGTSTEFTTSATTLSVAAGGSGTFTVTYRPTAAGADTGCIALTNNASSAPVQVGVSGAGVVPAAPAIAVSPSSLSFGTVTVGSSGRATLTVTNGGTAALNVTSIARCTGTSTEFAAGATSLTVAAGGTGTVALTYAPAAAGADTGCFTLANNTTTNPTVTVNVSGTGQAPVVTTPGLAVAPASLSFGNVTVGNSGRASFAVTNDGSATLASATVARCTGTSTEFVATPATISNLAAGATATVTVTYAPTAAGSDSGCFNVVGAGETIPVSVSGAGQAPVVLAPVIAVAPMSLSFGTIDVGSRTQQTTVVSNTGDADLTVTVASCTGTSAEFSASPASFTVAPAGSATVTVAYQPTGAGADTGCVAIASNDTVNGTQNVTVTGAGQAVSNPVVDVDIVRFSVAKRVDISRGGTAAPKVSLVNNGTVAGTVTVSLTGAYAATQDVTIAPGQTVKVSFPEPVTFGAVVGNVTWTVEVADQDPDADAASAVTKYVP